MAGITRTTDIPQANIFGRIGTGFGQGLAEQLPKEIERGRLSSALENLGKQQNLDPFQQFTGLVKAAHEYPQIVQSGGELLRQRGISEGFRNAAAGAQPFQPDTQRQPNQNVYVNNSPQAKPPVSDVATTEATQAALKPHIPATLAQLQARAGQLQEESPGIYPTASAAFEGATKEDAQKQAISNALQSKRQSEQDVQDRLRTQLRGLKNEANVNVPDNVYQPIENEALDAIESGEKTELEAAKDAQKKLDKISREYQNIKTVGNLDYMVRDIPDIKRSLKEIRSQFKERGDLENFAERLIVDNDMSPNKAYYFAYDVADIKPLNNILSKLPDLEPESSIKKGFLETKIDPEQSRNKTLKIAPDLAKAMGQEGSPLAVAEYLSSKGYDPEAWLKYVGDNRRQLDLTESQGRQLQKPRNVFPTLNDMWLFYSSGLDKLVER